MEKKISVAIKIFLGLVFFTSGMAKLFPNHAFPGIIGPVWLEGELAKYGLGLYARFIAYSQVIIGLLIFTIRFSTLGTIMMIPMILNILMVTISLNWRGTPIVLAVLLGLNLYLLWTDRDRLKYIFAEKRLVREKSRHPVRYFPFHDMIYVFALGGIIVSPFIAGFQLFLGYVFVIFGLAVCLALQIYEFNLRKKLRI